MDGVFLIYRAGDGYRWQLVTPDRRVIAISQEAFDSEEECRDAVEAVKHAGAVPVSVVRSFAASL